MSDHEMIELKICFKAPTSKNWANHPEKRPEPKVKFKQRIAWEELHRNEEKCEKYQKEAIQQIQECIPESALPTPSSLSDAMIKAGETTLLQMKEPEQNWFAASESKVRPLRDKVMQMTRIHAQVQTTDPEP